MKKFPTKEFFLRTVLLFILLIFFKETLTHLKSNSPKNTHQSKIALTPQENKKQQEETLRSVEKINAYIEEQSFILSIMEQDKIDNLFLKAVEKSIKEIELEAKSKSVENLINKEQIKEIKTNLQIYRHMLTQNI